MKKAKTYIRLFEEYVDGQDSDLTNEQIQDLIEDTIKTQREEDVFSFDFDGEEVSFPLGSNHDFTAVFNIEDTQVYREDGEIIVDWAFNFDKLLDEDENIVNITDEQALMLENAILTDKTMQKFDEKYYQDFADKYTDGESYDYDDERKSNMERDLGF